MENLGAVLSILAALISAAVAILLGWQLRYHQVRESESRADPSLNIDVFARVLKISEADRILEVRIGVKNNSRKTCCIPAVYVSARALSLTGEKHRFTGDTDFNELENCGKLSEIRNVARMENTVLQVAPDEIERFVRWDTLDAETVKSHPVIVVNVEAFSASADLIGERRYKYKQGKYRLDWIRFMNENDRVRDTYVVFARCPVSDPKPEPPLEPGRRYLRQADGKPDLENTEKFRKVLSTVVKWNRHTTVNLSPDPAAARQSPPARSAEPAAR